MAWPPRLPSALLCELCVSALSSSAGLWLARAPGPDTFVSGAGAGATPGHNLDSINPAQDYCGVCGSPLSLDEFISQKISERLRDAVQDRDVLERDSSIKVFDKAFGWMKIIIGIAATCLAVFGFTVGFQIWDFHKGAENARQQVSEAAKKSTDDISAVSSQSKQDVTNALDAAKHDITAASTRAIDQSRSMEITATKSKAEISKKTESFRTDLDTSQHQLRAAAELQPQIASLQKKLAETNTDVEAQKKLLSSTQDFVKSVFSTHQTDVFFGLPKIQGSPPGRIAIIPPLDGHGNTIVLLLLKEAPIQQTLQLQFHIFVQPPNSYFVLHHNLIIFFWGDPATNLEGKQLSASYFGDASDKEIIQSLSEHDGRWFADDQPLPKFGQPDPDFKGNKWMPLTPPSQPAPKP